LLTSKLIQQIELVEELGLHHMTKPPLDINTDAVTLSNIEH